jgi:MFS family permease
MATASLPTSSGREAVTGGLRADARSFARHTGIGYFPIAFIGRLPFAMMIVGVLTLVVSVRGSVAEAGLVAAAAGIGTAVCGPLAGSLADRMGQRAVLLVSGALSVAAAVGLLATVYGGAGIALIALVAVAVGGSTPQVAPFSRSRLVGVSTRARTPDRRRRALSVVMSYESAADEASFVLGPVLVGALTAVLAPWAPLAFSIILTLTVVTAFALHATASIATGPGQTVPVRSPLSVAFPPEVRLLIVAMLLVGAIFGSTLTAVTAFMVERGQGEQAGILYGAMSLGAIAVAVLTAALPAGFGLRARWITFAVIGVAACAALAAADSIPVAAVALACSGVGVGATLVCLFSLGAIAAPEGRSTTVLTTLQSSLVVGQALASATGGAIAQAAGSGAGFAVTAAIAGGLLVLGVVDRFASGPVSARV